MPADYGEPLSEREIEIVQWVAEGLSNREIAQQAFVSPNTVKVHLRNIFTKTGVASRTELTMLAVREGWVTVPSATDEALPVTPAEPASVPEMALPAEIISTSPSIARPTWSRARWVTLVLGILGALWILWLPGQSAQGNGPLAEEGALVDLPAQIASPALNDAAWLEQTPLPQRRARLGLAAYAGQLYAVGGLSAEGPSAQLDIYDIQAQTWRSGPPRPLALANVAAIALPSGNILVPGGCDAEGQPVADVHSYDSQREVWITLAPLPEPLCAYGLTRQGADAYLFGGWNGSQYRAVAYRYDSVTDQWADIPAPLQARAFGGAATLGTRIYYVGGYDGAEQAICEVFDTVEGHWERCAPMLVRRGGLGLVAIGGQIYAIGGGWSGYLGFNEHYRPETDTWSVFETPLVGEWRNLGLVIWETSIYAVGGWNGDYLNRTYMREILPFRVFVPITLP